MPPTAVDAGGRGAFRHDRDIATGTIPGMVEIASRNVMRHGPRPRGTDGAAGIRDRLRNAGLRPTVTRIRILARLQDQPGAVTPAELFRQMPADTCCLGSLYRTMAELWEAELLLRYTLPGGKVSYAANGSGSAMRLCCSCCGRTVRLKREHDLHAYLRRVCVAQGFRGAEDVAILTVCAHCEAGASSQGEDGAGIC